MNLVTKAAVCAAVALSLGACNTADLAAIGAAANTGQLQPTLAPGTLTAENLTAQGFAPSQLTKITAALANAQAVAKTLGAVVCPILPLAEGLANVTIASAATSAGGQTAKAVVNLACDALARAPTYTSFAHRSGELVTAYVDIGRFKNVPIYGVRR